jgi:heme-degrading monooxygenase HmoA
VILRVLTARVPNANIGEFNELLRAQLSELREQPGLVYVKLARRLDEDQTEEVLLVEEWRTTADLFAWTGGRLNRPRLLRGTEELVDKLIITHYEALDVSPEDLQQRVLGVDAVIESPFGDANDDEYDRDDDLGAAVGARADDIADAERSERADHPVDPDGVRPPSGVLRA